MPSITSTDSFIERSLQLLETAPSTTRVSITYGSLAKKAEKKDKVRKSRSSAESFVSFKVYDPLSGSLYKLTTRRAKELSRVLSALGPHGVQVVKKLPKRVKEINVTVSDDDGDVSVNDVQPVEETVTLQTRGFSSVLANSEIEEEVWQEVKEEPKKDAKKESGAKKGKKKKGKR
ncbi:Signal recognition particle subunit SRP21 [Cyberlindnera fabianii]|uniref:Signal recognition particle subunit SRP21 n=1 Tax=Cyberlindnera fabianii TaxID=36022 RepID=A0A1V2LAI0_CYBFA|nr:Signal recognition particle subunit SRP21 [Cyberlindnera fabianii]